MRHPVSSLMFSGVVFGGGMVGWVVGAAVLPGSPEDAHPGSGEDSDGVLVLAALAIICAVVLNRTSFGRWLYASGGNERAAELSGVIRWSQTAARTAPRASSSPG